MAHVENHLSIENLAARYRACEDVCAARDYQTIWLLAQGHIGERPIALGYHRYEWLYVTAFVALANGETVWFLSNGIDKPFFGKLLEAFARDTGAGRDRIIVLQLDNAGWHTPENLPVPDGIRLVYQPAYTPELQPAEHLWPLIDEPLANKHFDTIDDLDAVVALRCRDLNFDRSLIAQHTGFHWWPKSAAPN